MSLLRLFQSSTVSNLGDFKVSGGIGVAGVEILESSGTAESSECSGDEHRALSGADNSGGAMLLEDCAQSNEQCGSSSDRFGFVLDV